MKKKLLMIVLGTSLALTVGACGKKEESKPSSPGQEASADSSEKIFQKSCAGCHGNDLQGLSGPALQKVGGKYGKEDIEKIITKGRGAMPAGLIQGEDAKKVAEWLAEKK
ncbi:MULTISPECIES: cytochrome c551 [unclassified Bacillus (in: firmicutes)]|uniref:cytochrome c551 n=1 Tax=unclassified Bacillus (in: firmicutes) TaxID=185979 RepID=UPI0008E0E011|nr:MULTISPECIES: cytochrome c [unclassified Bacillus (in: firmicutes)]SFK10850.1 cytochrome c551 [Bacillus sp. 71mf]SFT09921.1 cytochrome c551 [Bacillus sp. 103mf]